MRSMIAVLMLLLMPGVGWSNPGPRASQDQRSKSETLQSLADATVKGQASRGYFNMGRYRLGRAKYEEALDLFHEAYRLAPQPQILFEIARCYVRMGKMSQAIATHRRYTRSFKAPSNRLIAALRFGELIKERNVRVQR